MGASVTVVWDDALTAYDFGPQHPLAPLRVDLTFRLARAMGVLDAPGVSIVPPADADDAILRLVHDQEYIDAVRRCSSGEVSADYPHGLGSLDNPVFLGMHDASARVAGASLAAAQAVYDGSTEHAVNIAGGLHHAMRDRASGFCVYNDPAIAIAWLLQQGVDRIAYVDVDVHHGDGVEAAFWDDARVLTISIHESGYTLFPQTGFAADIGGPRAEGTAVNVPLPAGTGDEPWLRAFHAVVPPLVQAWEPQILVSQHGCDSHFLDPLAHLTLSVDGQRMAYEAVHDLAHRHAGGRWVATGGGGYEIVDVVPRAWTHLLAIAAEGLISPQTPVSEPWREHVARVTGRPGPQRMTDGSSPEVRRWTKPDPSDPVDRAVMATRAAVFPHHGLDPETAL
jgi:acetoin utilization protein AcuC